MDEVIADALAEQLNRYNREFQERLTTGDLLGHGIWNVLPSDRVPAVERYIHADDFFCNLRVIPHSQRVLKRLQEDYEVYIATAAMQSPNSFNAKYDWLRQHFSFISSTHFVFCGDKGILRGDFLIDDNPRQLELFHGTGILYSSPANAFVGGFCRVNSWLEVEDFFLGNTAAESHKQTDPGISRFGA